MNRHRADTGQAGRQRTTPAVLPCLLLPVLLLAAGFRQCLAEEMPTIQFESLLEWNGPFFRVVRDPTLEQRTDQPVIETPFHLPVAAASRLHNGRKVVYVLDSGNRRVQAFEVNATGSRRSDEEFDWVESPGVPGPGEYGTDVIRLPEWSDETCRWILPGSDLVYIDGHTWMRVESLAGWTAADHVYVLDYGATVNHPQIELPAGSLVEESTFELLYVISDYQDGGGSQARYGVGDVDYGIRRGSGDAFRTEIDELSGGPLSWGHMRSMALIPDPADHDCDLLFLLDSSGGRTAGSAQLFSYSVTPDGHVRVRERYTDRLERPFAVYAAAMNEGRGASAEVDGLSGPFAAATRPVITDASQVTGRDYIVTVHSDTSVTIRESCTGRAMVRSAPAQTLADPFLGIPGISLALNRDEWSPGVTHVRTVRAYPGRYLFVADEGADRIKVIGLGGGTSTPGSYWAGDWLPGDLRYTAPQPSDSASVGAGHGVEYRPRTPAAVGRNWQTFTAAFPLGEGSLSTITFDPDRAPQQWTRVDDISIAGPTERVFQVDWWTGAILFGDGVHGAIPPAGTELDYSYSTTPDVARFGSSGTADERFTSPRGIAVRWNAGLRRFDLYVADTGNGRIQKLAFTPEDTTRHLPPMIRHLVSWSETRGGGARLLHPTGIDVAEAEEGRVYLAVSDPGSHQVHVFRDLDAGNPHGGAPPVLETSLGGFGNRPGSFIDPAGVIFMRNGMELDLHVTDATRGTVTRYEEVPVPKIELLFTDGSALPASFPPASGYTIRFRTQHAPPDGWVDFYFDTAAEFDERSARLCLPAGTVEPNAGSAFWRFSRSPGGTPPDGAYHLHARLRDAAGATVATDQSAASRHLTVDSRLVATLQAVDALDRDRTLYLQNNLVRQVLLELVYPDSVVGVGVMGSFDTSLVEIEAITPGTMWNGVSFTDELFSAIHDNSEGTFEVFSSVIGAPVGLLESGPHTIASVRVRCRPDAITAQRRVRTGTFSLHRTRSSMTDFRGRTPSEWTVRDLSLRAAYLGDIATTSAGADSVVPHLQPAPDGRIDFDDQMAFTLGWNGAGNVRDPIADMGPGTGTSPDILPAPDRMWDIDDLLVFTSQASYFYQAGWNRGGSDDPEDAELAPLVYQETLGSNAGVLQLDTMHPGQAGSGPPGTSLPLSVTRVRDADGTLDLRVDCDPLPGLMGAFLRLEYDIRVHSADLPAPGGLLGHDEEVLAIAALEPDAVVLSLSRVNAESPGVNRGGPLGRFKLIPLSDDDKARNAPSWKLSYDLRDTGNRKLAAGSIPGGTPSPLADQATDPRLFLAQPSPNPILSSATIRFGTEARGPLAMQVFDASGRRVRTLWEGSMEAGEHALEWDASDDRGRRLPGGIYFLRIATGGHGRVSKISVVH